MDHEKPAPPEVDRPHRITLDDARVLLDLDSDMTIAADPAVPGRVVVGIPIKMIFLAVEDV